jgi:ubiquitin C-terminal hydrolase
MTKGLINLGNTCYFNCALQCLMQTPQLSNIMLCREYKGECEFTKEYQLLSQQMWSVGGSVNPKSLLVLFRNKYKNFRNGNQHDTQEAFIYILDILSKSLGKFIRQIFYGNTVQETICKSGTSSYSSSSNIVILNPDSKTKILSELIEKNYTYSPIENYKDDKDVIHPIAATRTLYKTLPRILVISFNTYIKKSSIVLCDTLEMKKFVQGGDDLKSTNYCLYASCVHIGSLGGGHYICYTRHKNQWYLKDDDVVTQINKFPYKDYHYLFFYKLIIKKEEPNL